MSYVKWRLETLNRENGGFQFEALATDLLHATYASNIVPASGPVGPGDRGEDARTHTTYLFDSSDMFRIYRSPPTVSKRIYFAYSIEVNWRRKLRSDVKKIVSSGLEPEKVVFVTNQVVPTRTRQDAESAVRRDCGVEIEILDGKWVASQIESEHYALAVKYLGCDRAADPQIEAMVRRVLDLQVGAMSAEDATEVERLEGDVRYRAKYEGRQEQLVSDLVRLGDLLSRYDEYLEGGIRWYEEALRESQELTDAVIIADVYYQYFHALFRRPPGRAVILDRLPELMLVVKGSDIVDYYFRVLTWLLFLAPHAHDGQIDRDRFRSLWGELGDFLAHYDLSNRSPYVAGRIREMRIWMNLMTALWKGENPTSSLAELSSLLDDVSEIEMFSVGRVTEMLSAMSAVLDSPEYEALYAKAEAATASRESGFRVAELRRNRAVAHFSRGEWQKAVYHFNIVKALWRSDETLRGSLLSSLMLARCYRELGLFHAAKYEVAQCVYLATLLPAGRELDLVSAAYAELHWAALKLGYVVTAVEAGLWHIKASFVWGVDEEEREKFTEYFERNLLVLLPRLLTSNREMHDEILRRVGTTATALLELYRETVLTTEEEFEAKARGDTSYEEFRKTREAVLTGEMEPLEDIVVVDELRANCIDFQCSGVGFSVEYQRSYDLALVAETVAAWIPFLLLPRPTLRYDLAWIEERVEILVDALAEEDGYTINHVPDNYRLRLRVALSPAAARAFREHPFGGVFEVCIALFVQLTDMCTIAPTEEVVAMLDSLAEDGEFDRSTKQAPYGWAVHKYLPRLVGFEADDEAEEAERTQTES